LARKGGKRNISSTSVGGREKRGHKRKGRKEKGKYSSPVREGKIRFSKHFGGGVVLFFSEGREREGRKG